MLKQITLTTTWAVAVIHDRLIYESGDQIARLVDGQLIRVEEVRGRLRGIERSGRLAADRPGRW